MSLTTGNNSIDSLVSSSWASSAHTPVSLTYSFMTRLPSDATTDDANGFKPMTEAQKVAARAALATWSAVANITFTEVSSNGKIQLGTNDQSGVSSGYAYLPDGHSPTYLFTSNVDSYNSIFTPGTYGPMVLIHELGHTLGLKHPGNYDSTGTSIDGPFLPSATDNTDYSVMSYNVSAGSKLLGKYDVTPMLYDIQAMQYLYGANMSYHTGDDVYQFVKTTAPQCIWDAGGNDTLDFSACTGATTINLNAGTFSSTAPGYNNISIAYNVTIERAIAGNGGSVITANDAGNVLVGGSGVDLYYEGKGNDQIAGGEGIDTVVFKSGLAAYTLAVSGGNLVVVGDGTDTLSGVETLQFSDITFRLGATGQLQSGGAGNDIILAAAGNNVIDGGAGVDTVWFNGTRGGFQLTQSGSSVLVTGGGAQDLLTSVERLHFSDGTAVAFDVAAGAVGGEVYRLYQAAFNRTPDASGLGYWINVVDKGAGLADISAGFLVSAEFVAAYGAALSNSQLINQLYSNVLHRAGEAAGIDYWNHVLDTGGATRAQVLAFFAESPENIATVGVKIAGGFDYITYS